MRGARVLRPFVRAVRSVDHAIGRAAGRRTVLIEARTPMNLAVLRPVFEPLLQDRAGGIQAVAVAPDGTIYFANASAVGRIVPF